ncbi:MAG: 1,6-anhydro-N-acetylmuramyl-L-alanine amidase AmpD [Proteobacteria bacterium]|nr:MAG: 1,6-anhydro-N-acetylmuramyl-L-alanine amidase AmpD [Pseudomonadota bacterium]
MLFKTHLLPHFGERPAASVIDTIVIHAMHSAKAGRELDPLACFETLQEHQVSAHYAVSCDGSIFLLVPEEKRAFHAGESRLPFEGDMREKVNDFSIGVELIATAEEGFSEQQYQALSSLTTEILTRHSIRYIVGHEHIAPGRKSDPGPRFDWKRYEGMVRSNSAQGSSPAICFGGLK